MTAKTKTNADGDTGTKPTSGPVAARKFKDADTGRSFVEGESITDVAPALLDNYRAAGLLRPDELNDAQQIVADGQDAA